MSSDSLSADERPFIETEPIDLELLQNEINLVLGNALADIGVELTYDERIVRAADEMLRHPEYQDSTDENGYLIPFDYMLLEKEGCHCRSVYSPTVSSKTVCPTIRNFDESDTYAAIAERYVAQMLDGNEDVIRDNDFKAYGVGVNLSEEYPRKADGRILTDESKDNWIHVLFFIKIVVR